MQRAFELQGDLDIPRVLLCRYFFIQLCKMNSFFRKFAPWILLIRGHIKSTFVQEGVAQTKGEKVLFHNVTSCFNRNKG